MENYELPEKWLEKIAHIDYAFQPIIHPKSGHVFALEALMRNVKNAGFSSIENLLESAFEEGLLFNLDLKLRDLVFSKFVTIPFFNKVKLFYNFDHRILEMKNYDYKAADVIIEKYDLDYGSITMELSEKYRNTPEILSLVHQQARRLGFKIAIDDFGSGFSNFDTIVNLDIDYVKLDGSLVSKIHDTKYRIILQNMVKICQDLDIKTIAEYISDESIMAVAQSIGVDYLQGYHLHQPQDWNSVRQTFDMKGDENA